MESVRKKINYKRWVIVVILLLLLAYTFFHLGYSVMRYFGESDFDVMFKKAVTFKETGVYPVYGRYTYPPFFFIALLPFTSISAETMKIIAYIVFFLMLVASIFIFSKVFYKTKLKLFDAVILSIICFNFLPLIEAINAHQIESFELLLVSLSFYFFMKKRDFLCGSLLTFAANLKFFPGIFIFYFLYKREWKVILSSILTQIFIFVLSIFAFGSRITLEFFLGTPIRALGFETKGLGAAHSGIYKDTIVLDQSLRGAISRLFADPRRVYEGFVPVSRPEIVFWVTILLVAALIIFLGYLFRKKILDRDKNVFKIELLITSALIFFITPASVVYYAVFLLPVYIFAAHEIIYNPNKIKKIPSYLMLTSYILVGIFLPLGIIHFLPRFSPYMHNLYFVWWYSIPVIGYFLGLLALILMRVRYERYDQGAVGF